MNYALNKLIVAVSTPAGAGAIAILRLSGEHAISCVDRFFKGRSLLKTKSHHQRFGIICDEQGVALDEVLVSIFRHPASYTGEEMAEISCHGSRFIQQALLQLFIRNGAVLAQPGEFTMRAYMNGKLDLSQAEAVGDLIAAEHEAAHRMAMHQMRGGFSEHLTNIREKLLSFSALIELELDFGEEDVEFANRDDFNLMITEINHYLDNLIQSFKTGQAIKKGIATVIAGKPNAGKSTLLNALLSEDKAIISEIPGTTRDVIEDLISIEGILFRLIDTAGLRDTDDPVERIGVQKTRLQMEKAAILVYMFDLSTTPPEALEKQLKEYRTGTYPMLLLANKTDLVSYKNRNLYPVGTLFVSTNNENDIDKVKSALLSLAGVDDFLGGDHIVSHARHYEALLAARTSLQMVSDGLKAGISGDLLAMDIREVVKHIGSITGDVDAEELLGYIFGRFCIGK